MKRPSLPALAIAGTLGCAAAVAHAGGDSDGVHGSIGWPASVSEFAQARTAGTQAQRIGSARTSAPDSTEFQHVSIVETREPMYVVEVTEYWMIGSQSEAQRREAPAAVGTTSGAGGGSGSFDSSSDASSSIPDRPGMAGEIIVYTATADRLTERFGERTALVSEHYLVPLPLQSFDGSGTVVLAIGPTPEDAALLKSLSEDFAVVTPSYSPL